MTDIASKKMPSQNDSAGTAGNVTSLYENDKRSALEAKEYAQWIAFGPSVFQAARALRETGVLSDIEAAKDGTTVGEVAQRLGLSDYGVRVLLEAGLGIGLVTVRDERYRITKTAHYLLHDAMTRANMDFTHDVNYLGLFDLESSVRDGAPNGLKRFGSWPTVYRALAHLPPTVRQSWFAFDQFYSDNAFSASLPLVFAHRPRTLLDIGGNTGKWAQTVLRYDPEVHVTLADLPGQLRMAQKNLRSAGLSDRASFLEADMLDANSGLSGTYDAIWMSQFLDCFSEAQIVTILRSCVPAMTENGRVYILEPFWDRQRFATAAFCLQQTSLYFTAIANGNSQMYDSRVFLRCIDQAGLTVTEQHDGLGIGHTLLSCQPRGR